MENSKRAVICGAGRHAIEVASALRSLGYSQFELLDESCEPQRYAGTEFALGTGTPAVRKKTFLELIDKNIPVTFVDSSAVVDSGSSVGRGVFIASHAVVSHSASIGEGSLINWHVSVGHDVKIGAFSVVGPGAILSGGVHLGEGVFIGAGAILLPGVSIGDFAVVGAGSVVTKSFGSKVTIAGNPARILER
jgi:acetyltransferase EpsM